MTTVDPAPELLTDLCIIGAGPAGLTLAHELAGSGVGVLILEAGTATPAAGGHDVHGTRNVGLPYLPASTRSSGVGGSSLRWRVSTPEGEGFVRLKELDPQDFEPLGWSSSASGWPITFDTLQPHYDRARALVGLPPADGRDDRVTEQMDRRVYSFVNRKVFTTTLPRALAARPDVRLLAGCRVVRLVRGRDGRVVSLSCQTSDCGPLTVRAKAFVLAGGGIENPRLLLASGDEGHGTNPGRGPGLGNEFGHVGRWFMEHPHYFCGVVVPRTEGELASARDSWDVVRRHGGVWQDKYALTPGVRHEERLLNAVYKVKEHRTIGLLGFGQDGRTPQRVVEQFRATGAALRSRSMRGALCSALPLLGDASAELARYGAHRLAVDLRNLTGVAQPVHDGYRVLVMAEQEPSPLSCVRLAEDRDEFGIPLAELDWRLGPADLRSMVVGQRLIAPDLGRVVGGRVVWTLGSEGSPIPGGGAHHMGTTRMSATAKDGVVDPNCRVHGVPNLWVAGSSVFPRSGAANPTLTIIALAVRLAARLRSELRAVATSPLAA